MLESPAGRSDSSLSHRILAVLPIPYGDDWGFWYRDLGLVVRTLRSMGHDAWLVALRAPGQTPSKEYPVIVAERENLEDPSWWQSQAPWGAILNFWGANRWEGIRRAARSHPIRLVEKLDTDGVFSMRIWPWRYFYEEMSRRSEFGRFSRLFAPMTAMARGLLLRALPGIIDQKRAALLSRMPAVAAESPVAVERTKRYIRDLGLRIPDVHCVPHPVDEADLSQPLEGARRNQVISVGRWDSHQKNLKH